MVMWGLLIVVPIWPLLALSLARINAAGEEPPFLTNYIDIQWPSLVHSACYSTLLQALQPTPLFLVRFTRFHQDLAQLQTGYNTVLMRVGTQDNESNDQDAFKTRLIDCMCA